MNVIVFYEIDEIIFCFNSFVREIYIKYLDMYDLFFYGINLLNN